jgi:NTE family protein
MTRALVLGAGGIAAYAWEIGLICGMADAGLDPREADLFVGTSAGARVAAQLAGGASLEQLFQSQLAPPNTAAAPAPKVDVAKVRADILHAKELGGSPTEMLKRQGAIARATPPDTSGARRNFVASQLPSASWPERKILIATVNTETGERTAFDSGSGISLLDAVMASGAVAGMYQAIEFRGHHFMDGGFYAVANADLAAGCDRVLVLTLPAGKPPMALVTLESTLEKLQAAGSRVEVILPDDATETAFATYGGMFSPAVAAPAARAAREQGRAEAKRIAAFWR